MLVIVQSLRVPALRPAAIAALVRTFQADKIDKVWGRAAGSRDGHTRETYLQFTARALDPSYRVHAQWGTVAAASTLTMWRVSSAVFKALAQLM